MSIDYFARELNLLNVLEYMERLNEAQEYFNRHREAAMQDKNFH